MTEETRVEWHEGEVIEYFDDLVEKIESGHSVTLERSYMDTFNAIHLSDWKQVARGWLGDLIDDLQAMLEEIEELPENEDELILVVNKQ